MTYETLKSFFESKYPGKKEIYENLIFPIFNKAKDLTASDTDYSKEVDKSKIKSCSIFAQSTGAFPITFAEVELNEGISIKNNRVAIQNCVRRILENNTNAIIFFYQSDSTEWRVSYVHRGTSNKDSTSAKRYTYLCGPDYACRTIAERFETLRGLSVIKDDDLLAAFSVESLTKQFYNEIFSWYEWACQNVTFPKGDTSHDSNGKYNVQQTKENNNLNLIRLITRIIFVWFIKQKDLVPSWIFDKQALKNILVDFDEESDKNGNYYNAILQNLFFATLNNEIEKRSFADDENLKANKQFGIKRFYRDNKQKSFFKITHDELIEKFKAVPFLNGGLFECLDHIKWVENNKRVEVFKDGFSRESEWMAFIPNMLFFQNEKNGHIGLFQILNRYNFTIEENTPSDMQVSLDPELLGKVFENLLGTYNPETSETARKDSGSFYTPRDIVNFMTNESLISYLESTLIEPIEMTNNNKVVSTSSTTIMSNKIRSLVESDENVSFSENESIEILKNIDKCKIFDPACGSGAFPMGILQKMVDIIRKLDPNNIIWKQLQIQKIQNNENISVETKKKLVSKINSVFDENYFDYGRKLFLIENCIYGSDIQPIAIQIAKLRFFISLIVDQKVDNSKKNHGIRPLPNLETKFVTSDSLISLKTEEKSILDFEDKQIKKYKNALFDIRKEHFTAQTIDEKRTYRDKDKELRAKIIDYLKNNATKINQKRILELENQKLKFENQIKNLPVVMESITSVNLFGESDGLSYDKNKTTRDKVQSDLSKVNKEIESLKNQKKMETTENFEKLIDWNPYDQNAVSSFFDAEWMFGISDGFDIVIGNPPYISTKGVTAENKKRYEAEFGFSDDTYNLFTFKGMQLAKTNGTVNFITPKTFWTTQTKRNMRDLLLGKQLKYIFDTANPFDAVMVDTCIFQVQNKLFDEKTPLRFLDGSKDLKNPVVFEPILQTVYQNTQNAVIFKPTELNLKIWKKYGEKVKELYDEWWDKIETSKKINDNEHSLKEYRESLKPGDVALLGCLTEGGQGLATANNGKYIAVRKSSKWAEGILKSRPKKLEDAIKKNKKLEKELNNIDAKIFLSQKSEKEIAQLFDSLKEKYGRDIFGQGYIYKLIDDNEIADVETLTKDEKENGISTKKKYYVPYDKGDKDGNRWYLETPFAIAWSKENVGFLKTNSGKKGEGMPVVRNPQFYFREGFCWILTLNENSEYQKARLKEKTVNDVNAMALYPFDDCKEYLQYFICLINSYSIFQYKRNFVSSNSAFQINDARQLPILIPTESQLKEFKSIFDEAYEIKKKQFAGKITEENAEKLLEPIQNKLDELVEKLYGI